MSNPDLANLIRAGIEQADRGELIDAAEVFARLEERARQIDSETQSVADPALANRILGPNRGDDHQRT